MAAASGSGASAGYSTSTSVVEPAGVTHAFFMATRLAGGGSGGGSGLGPGGPCISLSFDMTNSPEFTCRSLHDLVPLNRPHVEDLQLHADIGDRAEDQSLIEHRERIGRDFLHVHIPRQSATCEPLG